MELSHQHKLAILNDEIDRLTELSQSYDDPDLLAYFESLIAILSRELNALIKEEETA